MWWIIASAAVNMYSQSQSAKAQGKDMLKAMKLKNKAIKQQLSNNKDAYQANIANIERQEMANDIAIEKERMGAEDRLSTDFAGSGISGTSIDEMDAQISADSARAHNENRLNAENQESQLYMQRKHDTEGLEAESKNQAQMNWDAAKMNMAMTAIGAAVSVAGEVASSPSAPKPEAPKSTGSQSLVSNNMGLSGGSSYFGNDFKFNK